MFICKENFRLGIGSSGFELDAALAMLNWFIKAAISIPEAEHARDIIQSIKLQNEGRE